MNANAGEFIKKLTSGFLIILILAQICMTFLFLWTKKWILRNTFTQSESAGVCQSLFSLVEHAESAFVGLGMSEK